MKTTSTCKHIRLLHNLHEIISFSFPDFKVSFDDEGFSYNLHPHIEMTFSLVSKCSRYHQLSHHGFTVGVEISTGR